MKGMKVLGAYQFTSNNEDIDSQSPEPIFLDCDN